MIVNAFHANKVRILKDGGKELGQDIVNPLNKITMSIENSAIFHLELPL